MLKIEKFQISNDDYTVAYGTFLESFRFSTGDEPRIELINAARDLVGKALALFGFDGIPAFFHSIEISHGEEPGSKLVLRVPTKDGGYAKIQCPKVDANEVLDYANGGAADCPQNDYNNAVQTLTAELEIFINGKRQQMSLPFDEASEEEDSTPAVADKVLEFGAR